MTSLFAILPAVAPHIKYKEGIERAPSPERTPVISHSSIMSFPSLRKADITVPGVGFEILDVIEANNLRLAWRLREGTGHPRSGHPMLVVFSVNTAELAEDGWRSR